MKKRAKEIIRKWMRKNVDKREIKSFSHWQFRCYVLGYAAPGCLITTKCWADSEPQMKDFNEKYPINIIRLFDHTLEPGDWCFTCYIVREGIQEEIALPLELLYEERK